MNAPAPQTMLDTCASPDSRRSGHQSRFSGPGLAESKSAPRALLALLTRFVRQSDRQQSVLFPSPASFVLRKEKTEKPPIVRQDLAECSFEDPCSRVSKPLRDRQTSCRHPSSVLWGVHRSWRPGCCGLLAGNCCRAESSCCIRCALRSSLTAKPAVQYQEGRR